MNNVRVTNICLSSFLTYFIFLACFFYSPSTIGSTMKGTEFWFGIMEGKAPVNHTDPTITINAEVNTSGIIEVPGFNWSQAFSIPANSSVEFQIPANIVENFGNMTTSNMGIHIQTQDSVYVNLLHNATDNFDATSIVPLQGLGYSYYATSYSSGAVLEWSCPQVLIVATENNTRVQISPSGALSNQQVNPFSINLNKGQCYQIQSRWLVGSQTYGNDLSGTLIESVCNNSGAKHPIAVFSGNLCAQVGPNGGCDPLLEQLHNYRTWGNQFIIVPPKHKSNYKLKVVAAYNNTTIFGNNINPQTLNAGQSAEINTSGEVFLSANNPVSVAQITYGAGVFNSSNHYADPMMSFIPSTNHLTKSWGYQSFALPNSTLNNFEGWLTIITPTNNINNVFVNNNPVNPMVFNVFGPNNNYSWAIVDVSSPPTIATPINISSSGGFIALAYGYSGSSYYMHSGISAEYVSPDFDISYLQDTTNHQLFEDTVCACEPVTFLAHYYDSTATLVWDYGDGNTGNGFVSTHSYLNGSFDVTLYLQDKNGCIFDTLIKKSLVVVNCDISMSITDTICVGDSVTLAANIGTSFAWSTGDTTASIVVSPSTTTGYSVQINGGNSSICDSIIVYVDDPFDPGLMDSVWFCLGDSANLEAAAGYNQYMWSNGSNQPFTNVTNSGTYWVSILNNNGCSASDTTNVVGVNSSWTIGPDIVACEQDSICLAGPQIAGAQYTWSTSSVQKDICVTESGSYSLVVSRGACVLSDTVYIVLNPIPIASPNSFISLCDIKHSLESPFNHDSFIYSWSTGDSTSTITVDESGIYWLNRHNACGSVYDTLEVLFDCSFSFYAPNAFTPDGDGLNDVFEPKGMGITEYELRIFDRWGNEVFFSTSLEDRWDGTYKGSVVPVDTYVWDVRLKDLRHLPHKYNGHVSVVK